MARFISCGRLRIYSAFLKTKNFWGRQRTYCSQTCHLPTIYGAPPFNVSPLSLRKSVRDNLRYFCLPCFLTCLEVWSAVILIVKMRRGSAQANLEICWGRQSLKRSKEMLNLYIHGVIVYTCVYICMTLCIWSTTKYYVNLWKFTKE